MSAIENKKGFPSLLYAVSVIEGGYLLRHDWPVMEHLHQPVVETLRGDGYRSQVCELLADDVGFI